MVTLALLVYSSVTGTDVFCATLSHKDKVVEYAYVCILTHIQGCHLTCILYEVLGTHTPIPSNGDNHSY